MSVETLSRHDNLNGRKSSYPGFPGCLPNWREYSRFSGLAARLARGVDGYQQLGQPERWSRG
jgi:hypothetical protein